VSLSFCTFIGFLQLRHRTRFRDSFCLASVFKCLFTYLLTENVANLVGYKWQTSFIHCEREGNWLFPPLLF